MKKLLWLVGIVLVVGLVLMATRSLASPERKACTKLHDLCGGQADSKSLEDCEKSLDDTKKLVGEKNYEHTMACVDQSASCAAAAGCMAGGVGAGAIGEFMKGFGTALSH